MVVFKTKPRHRFNKNLQGHRKANREFTHIAMPLAGTCKLQLSKGISGIFRGVLGAVPVVDNSCAEVVTEGHRRMGISCITTLAQGAIAARDKRIMTCSSFVASTQSIRPQRNVLHST